MLKTLMLRRLAAILLVLTLLATACAAQAARGDPNGDTAHIVRPYGMYVCYATGVECDFTSYAMKITTPGDSGPHVVTTCRMYVRWTLELPVRSLFREHGNFGCHRMMQSIIVFGALRNASAGQLGEIWHECLDMGHDNAIRGLPNRYHPNDCASVDSTLRHHSAELFFRFTLWLIPGYYWICHIWSPVAQWYGSRHVGRRGHYEFTGASNIAGWDHPPPNRSIDNAGKDHVHCDRFTNAGFPSPAP